MRKIITYLQHCVFLSFFILCGCISSILKEPAATFSNEVRLSDPARPFVQIRSDAYPSWKNTETQNIILMVSNCDSLYSVNTIHQSIAENLENIKIDSASLGSLKVPRPVTKQIHGTIDNEPVSIKTAAFQYKNCTYLSALSGKPETLNKDLETWKKFINSIELKK